jgi:hypothetical protein
MLNLCLPAYANSLVQVDAGKSGGDTVDLTFLTTGNSSDNIVVRKKSDTNYVILLPKISGENYRNPGVNSSVKELISDINVKSIDDSSGGYTKVTITAKKPLNITARTRKITSESAEEKEYSSLIAQVNAIKNKVKAETPKPESAKPAPEAKIKPPESAKSAPKAEKTITAKELARHIPVQKTKPPKSQQITPVNTPPVKLEELPAAPVIEEMDNVPDTAENITAQNTPDKSGLLVILAAGLIGAFSILSKFIKSSFSQYKEPEQQACNTENSPSEEPAHSEIAKDGLNWQEKYKTLKEEPEPDKYSFIKSLPSQNMFAAKNAYEEKRQSLEQMIEIVEDIEPEKQDEIIFVADEEDFISESLTGNIQLKGFASNPLNTAKRKRTRNKQEREYIMSSPDELFSVMDEQQDRQPDEQSNEQPSAAKMRNKISNPLITSLSKVKPPEVQLAATNASLVIKSGYDIDETSGFYIVNHGKTNALIGKIKDEVFVLKKFDRQIDGKIQVRKDKDNVYMVKTGGFKSLVQVGNNKMGVLVEL